MEDQLISFKTAKLAKEKGFDIVSGFRVLVYQPFSYEGELHEGLTSYDTITFVKEVIYLAPTQTFLQRWLREKHGYDVFVNYVYDTYRYAAEVHWYCTEKNVIDGFTIFDKYEDALEEGLQEALNLIY